MGRQVVATCTFTVSWDVDTFKKTWDDPDISDEELVAEVAFDVENQWNFYASQPETMEVQVDIVG